MVAESITAPTSVPCLVCGSEGRSSAALCNWCSTPMVLATNAAHSELPTHVIAPLGDRNAGKTVYLGFLLDMLSQHSPAFDAVPRGTFSVELQDHVMGYLAHRQFPPATPAEANRWHWANFELHRHKPRRAFNVVLPDAAGSALAAEVTEPGKVAPFRKLVRRAGGLLICIDAAAASRGIAQADMFGLKLVSYLDSEIQQKRKGRIATPAAIVLCKSDYCPEAFDDPGRFVEANLGRLWNACHNRFDRVEFFAVSAVGSVGYATNPADPSDVAAVPLHTAPAGILEPFEWLSEQL